MTPFLLRAASTDMTFRASSSRRKRRRRLITLGNSIFSKRRARQMSQSNKRKEALVTAEYLRELLTYEPETGLLFWRQDRRGGQGAVVRRAGDPAGLPTDARGGYGRITVLGERFSTHRLAWLWFYGAWPELDVDHINNDPTDNRISNLRLADHAQNMWNSKVKKNSKSGIKGVRLFERTGRWQAQIRLNGKNRHLGYFNCPTAAHLAYCKAAKAHFGEFAREK